LAPRVIVMPLPFTTFGEIKDAGYEVVVWCQGCRHRRLIKITDAIRDRPFAGQRFSCQRARYDGAPCNGSGVPVIQKEGRWSRQEARHARLLASISRPKP
jgi:hypothetical protein